MNATMQVRQRGTFTFPAELRKRHDIRAGDTYQVIDLDGIFVLTPMRPIVPELAYEIEQMRLEAGLSTDELLGSLREQRVRYVTETYGDDSDE